MRTGTRPGGHREPASLARPLVAAVACALLFVLVSLDVVYDGWASRHDPRVARWAYVDVADEIHTWARRLTHVGDAWFLAIVAALAAVWLLMRGRRLDAVLVSVSGAFTGLLTTLLKEAFHRARPPFLPPNDIPKSFAFPSGHASGAFCVYVLVALLLTEGVRRHRRVSAVAAALGIGILVAATRVLIPFHYLTDVVAGGAIGLGVASLAWLCRVAVDDRR